jgi:diguanylate cyclase (GGDEF)-like protein
MLTFRDADTERAFRRGYWEEPIRMSRFAMASAAVLWATFGYLDYLVGRDALLELWFIRYAIGLPTIMISLALSYLTVFRARYHLFMVPGVVVCIGCIIAMVTVTEPPTSDYYYAGLIIVLVFSYTFLQLPVVYATLAGIVSLLAYEYVAVFVKRSPFELIVNNTYFLFATNYVGVFACYSLERYRRKIFLHLRIIENDREQLAALTAELEELSAHDPLTGLYNRRQLAEHLEATMGLHERHGTPAAIMLIDLDDFKEINDRYGHLAGDELLRRTARVTTATIRRSDVAFRYGGDEFLVLLPDTTLEAAEDLAERLVRRVMSFGRSDSGFEDAAGISVGVAAINDGISRSEDLLVAADRALYAAKQQGKGCVVVSGQG